MACIRQLPGKQGGWREFLDHRGGVPHLPCKEPWPLLSCHPLPGSLRQCECPGRWISQLLTHLHKLRVHTLTSVNMHSSYYTGCMRHTTHRKSRGTQ